MIMRDSVPSDSESNTAARPSSDVAFTPRVKAVQARKGSRAAYARMEAAGGWATQIDPELQAFIEQQRSVFLATANPDGQPYIQHRGGPPGFLRVVDPHTIAFADFDGNRQFISQGNLEENPKAHLFLIDYATRRRVKIWGRAKVVENDESLVRSLMPLGYRARAKQAIVFTVTAWDANCPAHIPRRLEAPDVQAAIAERDARIVELEARIDELEARLKAPG